MSFPTIRLKKGKERSLKNFHPWVFSGAVQSADPHVSEGDIVEVLAADGSFLATGHYHEGSIKVRLFSFEPTDAGDDFWKKKIASALQLRTDLGLAGSGDTNVFRLVHGEGDGLPGLIVDVYDDTAVIQAHTAGMHRALAAVTKTLGELMPGRIRRIYDKSAEALAKQHFTGPVNGYLLGSGASTQVREHGLHFHVNWEEGQKTGFFIDQRENRKLLSSFAHGKTV